MTMPRLVAALVLVWFAGCGAFEGKTPDGSEPTSVREVDGRWVINEGDYDFSVFELPEEEGECAEAVDCAAAGCAAEVCTSSKEAYGLFTSCSEKHPGKDFECGCIRSRCRWMLPDGGEAAAELSGRAP